MTTQQIAARFVPQADLAVGSLAVFTDYRGREIGCRVERLEHGQVWCRVCGLEAWQGPYRSGDLQVMDAAKVRPAL